MADPDFIAACHERIKDMYYCWDEKRAGRLMPRRADLDPLEFHRLLPDVGLVDVVPDDRRCVYRLIGASEAQLRGRVHFGDCGPQFIRIGCSFHISGKGSRMPASDEATASSPGPGQEEVAAHYRVPGLLEAIRAGLAAMGKSPETVTPEDLAPIEEFHIGGRPATKEVLDQLGLKPGQHVLDIGCGIGGPARFAAHAYGLSVAGIDLTPDYVEIGQALSRWVGLADRVSLQRGSAADLPFAPATFDAGYMLHVGMNIADKETVCREAARVLKPGALFAIYDVMRLNDQPLKFPVPWAAHAGLSSVAPPSHYRQALQRAGFAVIAERNRRDFAITFFENLRAKQAAAAAPPPLALSQIMGPDAPLKIANLLENLKAGIVGPCEIIARKRAG